jgi:hypothetical protein
MTSRMRMATVVGIVNALLTVEQNKPLLLWQKKGRQSAGHAHQAVERQWVGGDKIERPTLIISA